MLIQIFIGTGVREFIDEQIKFYGNCSYSDYLKKIIKSNAL